MHTIIIDCIVQSMMRREADTLHAVWGSCAGTQGLHGVPGAGGAAGGRRAGNGNCDSSVLSRSMYGTGRGFSVRALRTVAHGDDGPGAAAPGLGEHDGGTVRGRDLPGDGQPEAGRPAG